MKKNQKIVDNMLQSNGIGWKSPECFVQTWINKEMDIEIFYHPCTDI